MTRWFNYRLDELKYRLKLIRISKQHRSVYTAIFAAKKFLQIWPQLLSIAMAVAYIHYCVVGVFGRGKFWVIRRISCDLPNKIYPNLQLLCLPLSICQTFLPSTFDFISHSSNNHAKYFRCIVNTKSETFYRLYIMSLTIYGLGEEYTHIQITGEAEEGRRGACPQTLQSLYSIIIFLNTNMSQ